ncbi:uncharacterized protein LOC114364840 isoform X1 [Ostrinia furnacalis]|uniref:uncharacterized protein LOC114364840 isoform X1 n=1 Tax=Ostrinia furnacalis TaxID=93504 RepID=UPI00103CCE39|nr:uncharacterized protein LOC114364840 isoform X1 [Ostrinia furnacalis]
MLKILVIFLMGTVAVSSYTERYRTEKFRVGIEYTKSLPMQGTSDRYRHLNNYDPFFVTLTTTAKKGFVITYLDVTATVDATGEVNFSLVRGETGSKTMVFQLVSNHSDFLSFSYLAHGMREEDYRKISNIIIIPMPPTNHAWKIKFNAFYLLCIIFYSLLNIVT